MKKALALILAVAMMALVFAGCSAAEPKDTNGEAETVAVNGIAVSDKVIESDIDTATVESVYDPQQVNKYTMSFDTLSEKLTVDGIMDLGKNYYYSKHVNTDDEAILYVIYCNENVMSFWYTDKWHKQSDFEDIKIGSTYNEVAAVDASTGLKLSCVREGEPIETFHVCDAGYYVYSWLTTDYSVNPTVQSVRFVADANVISLYNCEG